MAIYKDLRYKVGVTIGAASSGASQVLLKKVTATSGDSNITFDSSLITNSFKEYIFTFISMHPANDNVFLQFNASADNGSNYNVTKTTTAFRSFHSEDDSATGLGYYTGGDLAQSTDFQRFADSLGNDNDQSLSGTFTLFNPSSTTFVKHFIANVNYSYDADYSLQYFLAGYGNTTSAVDAIQFKMNSGNIDSGTIKLYGVT